MAKNKKITVQGIDVVLYEDNKEDYITNNFTLDCLISKDKDKCYRYIDRKHAKGNNQVNWLEPERDVTARIITGSGTSQATNARSATPAPLCGQAP